MTNDQKSSPCLNQPIFAQTLSEARPLSFCETLSATCTLAHRHSQRGLGDRAPPIEMSPMIKTMTTNRIVSSVSFSIFLQKSNQQ